jgi:hypothetical protein
MEIFSFRQQTVAAYWGEKYILFLWTLLLRVTAPAPQAAEKLLAVCPAVAELLAVMALRKPILSSTCLHPAYDVAEA